VGGSRAFRFKLAICILALVALAAVTYSLWFTALAYALIHDDGPAKADIAVVLAGDYYGHRIEKGGELVRAGYVPAVLVSGPEDYYGLAESGPAIQFAVRKGYPAEWFIPVLNKTLSTQEESGVLLDELRRRNIHSFLLVTSDYHTARARRIYRASERAMGGGPDMRVVAAPDEFFRANSWWRNRQARKTFFMEWCKTIATAIGM
jgi:uncharacterized SAM-binding protein YcdF (DUF218 family)